MATRLGISETGEPIEVPGEAANTAQDTAELRRVEGNRVGAQYGLPEVPPPAPAVPGAPPAPAIPAARISQAPTSTSAPQGEMGGTGVGDAIGSALVSPRNAPAGRVGLSPADRTYQGQLSAQMGGLTGALDDAMAQSREATRGFAQQSEAMVAESKAAQARYEKELEENKTRRKILDDQAKESQTRIDARLADLQAQGINPNHYFQSGSTAMNIMAGIAVAFGAFGAKQTGGNAGLQIINGAIANDIDTQRMNLDHQMRLMGTRLGENKNRFDMRAAALQAERESIQTAYTLAQKETERRMGMYRENAQVQTGGAQLIAQLAAAKADHVSRLNEQIYALNKAGERVVGGGTDLRAAIVKRTKEIEDKAAEGGQDVSPAEARRRAIAEETGVDLSPGQPMASYAKMQKSATAQQDAERQRTIDSIDTMAPELKDASTNFLREPGKRTASAFGVQDTQGQQAAMAQQRWNTLVNIAIHKQMGSRRFDPKAVEQLAGGYQIHPGDTQATINTKMSEFRKYIRSAPGAAELANPAGLEESP
jgi:hypothetical protein